MPLYPLTTTRSRPAMPHSLNSRIWDLPSGRIATIVEITSLWPASFLADDPTLDPTRLCYRVDDSIPLNPTGDGAYTSNWRLESEIDDLSNAHQHLDLFCDY